MSLVEISQNHRHNQKHVVDAVQIKIKFTNTFIINK